MDNTISVQKILKKVIIYTSAATIFTGTPAMTVSAAETIFQSESPSVPTETPGSSSADTVVPPAQTNTQTPVESTPVPPEAPSDTVTITPLPNPADQGTFDVTPMQSTVYAASQKGLNVRSGPSTSHSKLGTLKYGQEITVTGKTSDNWYQVQYSGSVGYVNADFVSDTPPVSTQTPDVQVPAAETPVPDNPGTEPEPVPPVEEPDTETDSEAQTDDDSSEEGYTAVASHLIGTPVYIVLAAAIAGVLALIGYSVYSLFKKDNDSSDDYCEDDYYEDEPFSDEEFFEDEPYSDEEFSENSEQLSDEEFSDDNEQFSDEEYFEDNDRFSDEEYFEDNDQFSDKEYFEDNDRFSDEEYFEDSEQFSAEEYFEDNDRFSDEVDSEDNNRRR